MKRSFIKRLGGFSHLKKSIKLFWMAGMTSQDYVKYLRHKGIRIGERVNFRDPLNTSIDLTRPCLVELGHDIDINSNFSIMTHDFGTFVFRGYYKDFVNSSGKVKIGNNIVFGRDVTILKGVSIGDNCIIGAGSIVSKSIPANSVAVGAPARVICTLDEYYQKRKLQQKEEALEYGRELASCRGGFDKLKIEDFTEEWVLFLSEEEYIKNEEIRKEVDFRMKGRVELHEFFERPRPYVNIDAFIKDVANDNK